MRHLTTVKEPFPGPRPSLEGEAHPGLEAVQGVGARLEEHSPAERPAALLIQGRLAARSIDASMPTRRPGSASVAQSGRPVKTWKASLHHDEVERAQARPRLCRASPSIDRQCSVRPASSARAAAAAPASDSSATTFAPMNIAAAPRRSRTRPRHRARDRPGFTAAAWSIRAKRQRRQQPARPSRRAPANRDPV